MDKNIELYQKHYKRVTYTMYGVYLFFIIIVLLALYAVLKDFISNYLFIGILLGVLILCLLFQNIYVVKYYSQLLEMFSYDASTIEETQKTLQTICEKYPRHKDRQFQIYAYLASLSYHTTSHELLKAFQHYQKELIPSFANEILDLLAFRFHNDDYYVKQSQQKLMRFQKTQKILPHHKKVHDNILRVKINLALFNQQYQKVLDLSQQLIYKNEYVEYVTVLANFKITNDTQILEKFLKEEHTDYYYHQIKSLISKENVESVEDKNLYDELFNRQKGYTIKYQKKRRMILAIYMLVLCFFICLLLLFPNQKYQSMQQYASNQLNNLEAIDVLLELDEDDWHIGIVCEDRERNENALVTIMNYYILSVKEKDGHIMEEHEDMQFYFGQDYLISEVMNGKNMIVCFKECSMIYDHQDIGEIINGYTIGFIDSQFDESLLEIQ